MFSFVKSVRAVGMREWQNLPKGLLYAKVTNVLRGGVQVREQMDRNGNEDQIRGMKV